MEKHWTSQLILAIAYMRKESQSLGKGEVKSMKDTYQYMNDYRCCWQCIQKDTNRSLHQGKRDSDAHSSERHISRYLKPETRTVDAYNSVAQFLWYTCPNVYWTLVVLVLTAVAPSSGVSFILSLGTVSRPITQLIHGDTQARGRTGPFSWVTLPCYIICRQKKIHYLCRFTHTKGKKLRKREFYMC